MYSAIWIDQRDIGRQPLADHRIDGLHIGRNGRKDPLQVGHGAEFTSRY